MRSVFGRALLGSAMLLLPACVRAQQSAAAPRPAPDPASPRTASPVRGGGNVTIINNNSPVPPNAPAVSFNFVPVPGLGFDIPHLAATRGPSAVGAIPSPGSVIVTGVPLFGSSFFLPAAPVVIVQAPPIVIQQPILLQPAIQTPAPEAAAEPAPAKAAAPAEAPLQPAREALEYVFVRRDGVLLFAVAFLWEKDHLEYITREGQRRTVAQAALDLDATQRFNEERGLSFRLPA